MINDAKDYILREVILPAIGNSNLDKKIIDQAKATKTWIPTFKKIGDLYNYLKRSIDVKGNNNIKVELHKNGLKAFEDIIKNFEVKYHNYLDDKLQLNDFILGEIYSAYDISAYTGNFNIQSGIYLNKDNNEKIKSIFIKATLESGEYQNEWIEENKRIKYYMQSRKNKKTGKIKFDENHQVNSAIIKSNNIPIYLFIKLKKNEYKFVGNYEYVTWIEEKDGSKWFELKRNPIFEYKEEIDIDMYNTEFENEISRISNLSNEEREKEKRKFQNKKPKKITIKSTSYIRNPYVVVEALERANGVCEKCKKEAPFIRKSDNSPYLEVHHIKPLSEDGEDSVENVLALCPNCHRELHFGISDK